MMAEKRAKAAPAKKRLHRAAALSRYVDTASERFQAAWPGLEGLVKRLFPAAQSVFEYGMAGWKVPLPEDVERPPAGGTIPSGFVFVLLADRKAGPVLHVWNPFDYYFLDKHKDRLAVHGLKTMRGCVQYARKGEYPLDAVESLLADVARQTGFR